MSFSRTPKPAVYIIESTSGHFKIGVSDNPKKRLKQLKATQGPYEYNLTYFWRCSNRQEAEFVEKYLHEKFDRCRVNGEWFLLTPQYLIDLGFNWIGMAMDEYERSMR